MSHTDPEIAVILPTLNGEEFIAEQIDALLAQECSSAWHLVVVDGGSTDATLDVVRQHTRDSPIATRIVELADAPGVNAGLNAGVVATDSPLLMIAEHDDVVGDGWMQALVEALADHWLVGSHMDRFQLNDPLVTGSRRNFAEDVQPGVPIAIATGMGFRRKLWDLLDGFDETYRYGGNDIEFCLRSFRAGHPATLVDGAVVHYRIRAGSKAAFVQGRAYGISTVRIHREFGAEMLPRRKWRPVLRDYLRLVAWTARAVTDQSYRMRVSFRGGLLLGYLRGSVKYRRLFL